MTRSAKRDSHPLTGLAQWRVGSIDGEGIRYGFAISAWKMRTATTASVMVSAQSTSVLTGAGKRDRDRSRIRTARECHSAEPSAGSRRCLRERADVPKYRVRPAPPRLFVVKLVRQRARRPAPVSPNRFDLSCEAGLEQPTPTFDEAPARVDQRYDEHRRHDCTDEEAQLGSCARSVCDEPHDDPGESCVDHRDERGSLADQAVEPAPRAWAIRLVQTLLVVVVTRNEVRLEPWRDLR